MKYAILFAFVWTCCCSYLTAQKPDAREVLATEKIKGEVWVSPNVERLATVTRRVTAKVWFEDQFLGSGTSYKNRIAEFSGIGRRALRKKVIATLQKTSDTTFAGIKDQVRKLEEDGVISEVKRHWIVNGMTCVTTVEKLDGLKKLPGVKKIFLMPVQRNRRVNAGAKQAAIPKIESSKFDPNKYRHPWYVRSLMVDKVWKEFGISGEGTLNVIHDFNFVFPDNLKASLYHNSSEIPDNGKDDDQNGLIDDVHGYNFAAKTARLTMNSGNQPQVLHGTTCANIVCGAGSQKTPYEFGIAPSGKWAGVIAGADLESAVEWAVLQGADTYSMSFSIPNLGNMRSHWRKVMEHGSYCGVYFVSGAGNFAQTAKVPAQMRVPEDIPDVVFAAAGVQRDLSRTPFSSQGPVEWKTEHYQDGQVQKPEVCAFNMGLPMILPNGTIREAAANGNSFAGPMFCGSISLMLSADPDLLPWDLKDIITSTALDVGPKGVDFQTGHGLINCYRAVKEVLRRRAKREGKDAARYSGRTDGDEIDIAKLKESLNEKAIKVFRLNPNGEAAKAGMKAGDEIKKIGDVELKSAQQIIALINKTEGDQVSIEIQRNGKTLQLKMKKANPGLRLTQTFRKRVFE